MGNRPQKGYDYHRAGVAMVTLKTRTGVRLCRITQQSFELTETGRIVQHELLGIPTFFGPVKIGQYQIMPDHLHVLVHVVRDLPEGVTLHSVVRGFKLGVNRQCRERFGAASFRVWDADGRKKYKELAQQSFAQPRDCPRQS
jgi:REP element-mobilizing transposase RayT